MPSPTQRTLKELRRLGYIAQVVEHWNGWAKKRQDLFGCIDIVALDEYKILGIQCTSGTNVSARIQKALDSHLVYAWLRAGGLFEVWGWRKIGARGRRKLYQVRRVSFSINKSTGIISVLETP